MRLNDIWIMIMMEDDNDNTSNEETSQYLWITRKCILLYRPEYGFVEEKWLS